MKLFNRNYDKPGPGVSKEEPRKKGAARFFELLARDFWDLVKLNLLFCMCVLPSIVMFIIGLFYVEHIVFFFIAACILAFPIGGALAAYVYYITKMMRDDPSYVWFEFNRKFKENCKQAAPVGMLCAAFIYAQALLFLLLYYSESNESAVWLVVPIISLIVFGMVSSYIFLHFAYVDLPTRGIIKNSILMTFGYLPRSFMGVILGSIVWLVFIFFLPASMLLLPVYALIGISFSLLLCLSWVWKPFNERFKIEETLIARQKEESEE